MDALQGGDVGEIAMLEMNGRAGGLHVRDDLGGGCRR